MLKNWITIAWRSITRQKATAILNIGGLSLGITGSVVIFLLISYLNSIDSFHANKDRIYRVVQESIRNGEHYYTPGVPTVFPDAFNEDFNDIEASVFISHEYRGILIGVSQPNIGMKYLEQSEGVGITENSYFKIFDRKLLSGNVNEILLQPNEVVVSQELAKKLFPDESALGKEIQINKEDMMVITGIMEDTPHNTDFPFEIFISYPTVQSEFIERGWGSTSSNDQFYVMLPKSNSLNDLDNRLVEFDKKHFHEEGSNQQVIHSLQPLSELHFDPRYGTFSERSARRSALYAMALVGFFLILTGCINYINLSTAVAFKRAKEVGIRKVMGGSRNLLIKQFLGETFIISTIAIIIALGLSELLIRFVNMLLEIELSLNLLENFQLWGFLVIILLFITLTAGGYPAFILSGFNPAKVLKKIISNKSSAGYQLRRGLIVFQFIISQVFIIGTIVLILQMRFIQNKDMGFSSDAIVNINLPESDINKAKALHTKLRSHSSVADVSLSNATPASGSVSMTTFDFQDQEHLTMMKAGDDSYLPMFEIKILSGRNITPADTLTEVIANEEFVQALGFSDNEEIIGQNLHIWGRDVTVVGVVENFHTMSLREKIRPLLIYSNEAFYNLASVKLHSKNLKQSVSELEGIFKSAYPEYDYNYEFFDDDIANFYSGERRMSLLLTLFSGFAIVIGCIGLYGLVSYITQQKVKEVGIRKVLGASVQQIVTIFSKEIVILIIIAFLISAPLAGFGMKEFLNNYQYRIELSWMIFALSIGATLLIALLTVGYKTMKAATANPVDALVTE